MFLFSLTHYTTINRFYFVNWTTGVLTMQKINIFSQLYRSIIDIKSYSYCLKADIGRAFLYLLILTLTLGSLTSLYYSIETNKVIDEGKILYEQELPDFSLTREGISVDAPMPIIIKDESENALYVIDTTQLPDKGLLDGYDQGVIVGRTKIIHKENIIETHEYDISSVTKITGDINKERIKRIFNYRWVVFVAIFFFYGMYYYGVKLFIMLFVALLGLIANKVVKTSVKYGSLYKLSAYAVTLPALLSVILLYTKISIPLWTLFYPVIAAVYIGLGLQQIKTTEDNGTGE